MKKKLIIGFSILFILLVIVVILWFLIGKNSAEKQQVTVTPKKGEFNITLTATGELEAKSSDYIYGPANLKNIGIFQVKINDIIPEGSNVKKGDYVASLDPTDISNKLKDVQAQLDRNQNLLNKVKLDTALDLRQERDKLASLKFNLGEDQVNLDESKYEAPATIRQAKLEVEKDKRNYEQSFKNYKLKAEQEVNKVQEINDAYNNNKNNYDLLSAALRSLTVRAPKDGIVLYNHENGNRVGAGSVISTFTNIVATMPDLTKIISRIYINEMDISKVSTGEDAEISIDAFPGKKFTGKVIYISNLGERVNNSDTKVFEVKILVNSDDPSLKPSMTTKNMIIVSTVKDAMYLPIECIHSENNIPYIYKQTSFGIVKSEVVPGQSNDNDVIITKGLNENDVVYLTIPENSDKLQLQKL